MKKITCSFILFFILIYSIQAQTIPIEKWHTMNKKNIVIKDIAYDSKGNIFTVGDFYTDNENVDFDSGEGVVNLSSLDGSYDVFITKQDSLGNLLWVKQIGGTDLDQGKDIVINSTGEIYISGIFWSTNMDFDPGQGEHLMSGSRFYYTPFIIKLTNDGEFVWVEKWLFDFAYLHDMNIDYEGNIYLNGYCKGTVDFDPNDGQVTHTAEGHDAFILKINSKGEYLWANTYSSSNEADNTVLVNIVSSLEFDINNNIYYVVNIGLDNSVDFDLSTNNYIVNTTDSSKAAIIKLSKNGDFIWGNVSNIEGFSLVRLKIDKLKNLYLFGNITSSVELKFEGVPQSLKTTGNLENLGIIKINDSGKVIAIKMFPQIQTEGSTVGALDYDLDVAGNIYFIGNYYGTINFSLDGTSHIYKSLTNTFAANSYLIKYSPNGEFKWFKAFDEYFQAEHFVVDSTSGNILIRGSDMVYIFDGGFFATTSTSALVKIGYCTLPEVPAVSDITTTCVGDELVLHATGQGTLGWYTDAIQGKHIATGSDFSVIVQKDTVFYVQDSTCYASASRTLVFIDADDCVATNTSEIYLQTLNIYPNPTSNMLFIDSVNEIHKIIITDVLGRIVLDANAVRVIDVSDLANGIYYVTITDGSRTNTQKIIKN